MAENKTKNRAFLVRFTDEVNYSQVSRHNN